MKAFASRALVTSSVALSFACASCGGEPPPPPAAPVAPVARPLETSTVDTSAVKEPANVVVIARVGRPTATLKTLSEWLGTPSPKPGKLGELLADMDIGDIVDVAHPLDLVLTVEGKAMSPKPSWAVSAALKPGVDAETQLREHFVLTPGAGGVVRLDLKKDSEEDTDRRCAIYPAYGAAASRLVCSDSEAALRELAPYLTRTRTRLAVAKDLEVEVRGAPLRGILSEGRQLYPALASGFLGGARGGVPGLSAIVTEAVGDVIDLGGDIERINLEASLSDAGADASLRVAFSGSTSLSGRILTAGSDKAGPPPAAFLKLPADVDAAFFGRGWDERDLARPKEILFQFARGLLDKQGIPSADAQALERAVNGYLSLGSRGWVSATGTDWDGVVTAITKLEATRGGKSLAAAVEAETKALEKLRGWSVWGVELPAAEVQTMAKDIVTAYNRPTLQKAVRTQVKDAVPLPTLKVVAVPAAAKLPKDSLHIELAITRLIDEPTPVPSRRGDQPAPKSKAKPKLAKPLKVHGFVVPDGERTWLAWGLEEALVTARLRAIVSGEGPTLAQRPGLDSLRAAQLSGGGFFGARAFAKPSSGLMSILQSAGTVHFPDVEELPTGDWGKMPLWLGVRGEGTGDRRATTLTVKVPRQTISDLASRGARLGRMF